MICNFRMFRCDFKRSGRRNGRRRARKGVPALVCRPRCRSVRNPQEVVKNAGFIAGHFRVSSTDAIKYIVELRGAFAKRGLQRCGGSSTCALETRAVHTESWYVVRSCRMVYNSSSFPLSFIILSIDPQSSLTVQVTFVSSKFRKTHNTVRHSSPIPPRTK